MWWPRFATPLELVTKHSPAGYGARKTISKQHSGRHSNGRELEVREITTEGCHTQSSSRQTREMAIASIVVNYSYARVPLSERFMLPLEKLCSNVLPFLVLLCVWKFVNFSTILIVNIAGSRLYNQRMKMLNVFCNTGDVCTEYLLWYTSQWTATIAVTRWHASSTHPEIVAWQVWTIATGYYKRYCCDGLPSVQWTKKLCVPIIDNQCSAL